MERSKLRSLRGLINISLLSLIFGAAIHILASLLGNYGAMALGAFGVLLTFTATAAPIARTPADWPTHSGGCCRPSPL